MPRTEVKSLLRPEQVRRFPNGRIETVSHHETTIGRILAEPGWRWSRDARPIAQTQSCQIHHLDVVLRGRLRVETDAGEVCEFEVDDVYGETSEKRTWIGRVHCERNRNWPLGCGRSRLRVRTQ